ncbi:hypothetical protein DPMN_160096 [Dreissena polymorpha]|uniref:Uncharacterized protein n=1 Tax=Dreissena polymorpha TaxID=45954 RepID=A0A9D4EK69_DREPO|nr:hypothetical protein DPMN_160096 [Dreissena polymorpha]
MIKGGSERGYNMFKQKLGGGGGNNGVRGGYNVGGVIMWGVRGRYKGGLIGGYNGVWGDRGVGGFNCDGLTDRVTDGAQTQGTKKRAGSSKLTVNFNLWQNFIGTNVLTKFHEDWPINVANIVTTAPPPLAVITNVLIKFHQDWIINVTSRVLTSWALNLSNLPPIFGCAPSPENVRALTRKNATPPCVHFHEHLSTNVTSRVLTRKSAPPHGRHVFSSTGTIFELLQYIIGTHVLTKFHEDWTKNVTSRVLTRKSAMTPGGHVFQPTGTIFKLFHEDWTKNVTSRVLTRKTATPPGGHVFQPTGTIFKLVQDIIGTHVLTKKTATPSGSHVFQPTGTIFKLVQDIIETHVLTKFHEDWTINVTFRVLTR